MIVQTTPEIAEGLYEHLLILNISSFDITVSKHTLIDENTKVFFNIRDLSKNLEEKISMLIDLYNQLMTNQPTLIASEEDLNDTLPFWYPIKNFSIGFENNVQLRLKKKIGFGIGLHPSTILALRGMDKIIKEKRITQLIDVGSGSGILSIFALLKGVKNIIAYEIQDEAIEVMKENIYLNNLDINLVNINPELNEGHLTKDESANKILFVANMRPKEVDVCKPILKDAQSLIISGFMQDERYTEKENKIIGIFQDWKALLV